MNKNNISTLTTPEDRVGQKIPIDSLSPPLTVEQTKEAVSELYVPSFPHIERKYADPVIPMQAYGLISFVPAKGATPNENGIFGFAKLRGNYPTPEECQLHSEELIRNHDSYHKIYTVYTGRPFPITTSSDFSREVSEVNLNEEVKKSYADDIKKKREKEEKDMKQIQEREKNLLEDVKKEEDPEELYTTLQVKRANLIWTYVETQKKMAQMKESILKTRKEITEMDEKDSSYREMYFKRYQDARTKAGLSNEQHQNNFVKFMCEDIKLDFDETNG